MRSARPQSSGPCKALSKRQREAQAARQAITKGNGNEPISREPPSMAPPAMRYLLSGELRGTIPGLPPLSIVDDETKRVGGVR
jgi:hypothetical protein